MIKLLTAFLFLSTTLVAQNFQWVNWSPRPGVDSDVENFNSVAVDAEGNSFLAVQFSGVLAIGGYSFQSNFVEDVAILKYNPDGDLLWAKAFGSLYWDQINGMDCDEQGNLYLTGHYFGVLWYDNDSLVGNAGGREMFLMKIQPNGDVAWAVNGANPWDEEGTDVRALPGGGVVMSGRARSTAFIGNLQILDTTLLMVEFIAAFNADGVGQWVGICGPAGSGSLTYSDSQLEIGPDSSIFIAYKGSSYVLVDQDTVRPWYYPEFSANPDVIVQKFSPDGVKNWGWIGGSLGHDLFGDFTVDPEGRIFLGMNSPMMIFFDNDSLEVTPGDWSSSILTFDPEGNEDLYWHFRSSGFTTFQSATCDDEGNVWMGGILRDTLIIEFGILNTETENHRVGALYRINANSLRFDHYNQIHGQGWYSVLSMTYSQALGSLIFGGNATGSSAAPTSYGLAPDTTVGYSFTGGNWAYIARYKADSCETPPPLVVSDPLICPGQTAIVSYQDTLFYPHWGIGSTQPQITFTTEGIALLQAVQPNGCIITLTATIQEAEPVQFESSVSHVTCNGLNDGEINLTLNSGQQPVTYSWLNGQNGESLQDLVAGSYTVTALSVQGCTQTQTIQVNQPNPISVNMVEANGLITVGSVNGGTPPFTYVWNNLPDQTGNSVPFTNPGNYTVTVTDANGCDETESLFATSISTPEKSVVQLFPNPTSNMFWVSLPGDDILVDVFSADGRCIFQQIDPHNGISTENLAAGMYLVKISKPGMYPFFKRLEVIHP